MVGGLLYLNTPLSVGAAIDARTGATRWVYNPKSYEAGTTTHERCAGISAAWRTGRDGAARNGSSGEPATDICIAVDAKTGTPGRATSARTAASI